MGEHSEDLSFLPRNVIEKDCQWLGVPVGVLGRSVAQEQMKLADAEQAKDAEQLSICDENSPMDEILEVLRRFT